MKIYKVAIETLLQDGFVVLWTCDYRTVNYIIYDLALANERFGYSPDHVDDTDILLYDYFEDPLEPTETEMSLFQLEFGFGLEFWSEHNGNL